MAEVFHTQRFVEFSDTDMAGIAHFSAFFRYMESAEHALLRSLGLSVFQKLDGDDALGRVGERCLGRAGRRRGLSGCCTVGHGLGTCAGGRG